MNKRAPRGFLKGTGVLWIALGSLSFLEASARVLWPLQGQTFVERTAASAGLAAPKAPAEKRVFVFGASSVIGYHHLGQSDLGKALLFALQKGDPHRAWRVVNFGKAGEGSGFVLGSAREALRFQPDLVVLYVGENEFIPPSVLRRQWRFRLERLLLRSKLFRLLRVWSGRSADPSMPDFASFSYADLAREIESHKSSIVREFETRLRAFETRAKHRTLLIILHPVGNMLWAPSFYDRFETMDYNTADPVTADYLRGVLHQESGRYADALSIFNRVLVRRPDSADVHFRAGMCALQMGDRQNAWPHFQEAVNQDPIPNRTVRAIDEILRRSGTTPIDLPALLARQEGTPLLGYPLLEDNCHPGVELEWRMAQAVLEQPRVQAALNLSRAPQSSWADYRQAMGLDPDMLARIYSRVGQYHNGRTGGEYWFRKALTLRPHDRDIQTAWLDFQKKNRWALEHKRLALNALRRTFAL